MVNIAVFAAFRCVIDSVLLANPEFKPICGVWELDVSRYGWQKWQDVARCGKVDGKIGGKSGKDVSRFGHTHAVVSVAAVGCDCHACLAIS